MGQEIIDRNIRLVGEQAARQGLGACDGFADRADADFVAVKLNKHLAAPSTPMARRNSAGRLIRPDGEICPHTAALAYWVIPGINFRYWCLVIDVACPKNYGNGYGRFAALFSP